MNAIKRFIDLLKSPLIPVRLFVTEESNNSYGEELGTDESGNTYYVDDDGTITMVDSSGNATTESKDERPSSDEDEGVTQEGGYTYDTDTNTTYSFDSNGNLIDADNGKAADTSNSGKVIGVSDANGNTVMGYTYAGQDANGNPIYTNNQGRTYTNETLDQTLHNIYGGEKASQTANNIALSMGNSLNGNNTKIMSDQFKDEHGGETLRQALADNADAIKAGQKDTGLPVMVALLTGTLPQNTTPEEANTFYNISDRVQNGEDFKSAFYDEMDKAGYTANEQMNSWLKEAAIQSVGLFAGPVLSALAPSVVNTVVGRAGMRALGKGAAELAKSQAGRAAMRQIADMAIRYGNKAVEILDKSGVVAAVASSLGITTNEARGLLSDYANETKRPEGDSSSENTGANTDKTPNATPATSKSDPEPTSTRSDTGKPDPTFTNPFGTGGTDISVPQGPLAGTPLAGTGLPGGEPEPTKEDAEERGYESDDTGSDTMEETSQDAPSSGLGGDTFINPNDDNGRHGWGLGEEDPNRSNYDMDKWNRGMERVSTDVVSDEKCKNFIKKTFKDDPVLIRTVKIMKSL